MALIKLYNQAGKNLFQPSRLIFAKDKDEKRKGIKSAEEEVTSPEYLAYLKEFEAMEPGSFGKEVADQFRALKIKGEVFKEIRENVIRDPGKMQKDKYKWFMKALGAGKFTKRSENALGFLKSLESSSPKERERAEEIIKNLAKESTGQLTEPREERLMIELANLGQEDLAKDTLTETSVETQAITQMADVSKSIDQLTKTEDNNWQTEKAPESLVREYERLLQKRHPLAQEASKKYDELKQAKLDKKLDKALIDKLQEEIIQLNKKIDKLTKEIEPHREALRAYFTRNGLRFRALNNFFKRAGIDVKTAERIKLWFINLTNNAELNEQKANLKLMGIKVDPGTGKALKEETTIEITGLFFDDEKTANDPESPGTLHIQYKNEKGEECESSFRNFIDIINTYEAYEEVDSVDELNKRLIEESGYKELAAGQEYTAKTVVALDEDGKKQYATVSFEIEEIDTKKHTVRLKNTVKKTPKECLPDSVHDGLYFDRLAKEFNFGEFIKFVKQRNFKRKVGIEETPELCQKANESLVEECAEFVKGHSEQAKREFVEIGGLETGTLNVPGAGQKQEVIFLDNNGLKYWGTLSRKAEQNGEGFYLEEIPEKTYNTRFNEDDLKAAGVPSSIIATHWGKFLPGKNAESKTITSQKLDPHELAALLKAGRITNAPKTKLTQEKFGTWEVVKDPDAVAAMSVADKHAHGPNTATGGGVHDEVEEHAHDAAHDQGAGHGHEDHGHEEGEHGHDEHGHDEHGHDEHAHGHGDHGPKGNAEALPFDQINKVGGMEQKEVSFLRSLWTNTRFLSMGDLWTMGKTMYEYYDRRFERNQKDKFARVGEEIPYFAPEMRRVIEATEHEAVHQFQEAFNYKGVFEIRARARATRNKDELKATLVVLSEKGELRWDDIELWKSINRWCKSEFYIPIPGNGDPYTKISETDSRTGLDFMKDALDSIWGEGTYNGWYQKNKSSFSSNAKGYYEEGSELEGVPGGHAKRLAHLLKLHKQGHYVNPHEYEGLILHSIENGKSNMITKFYYMMEGVAAVNGSGETILPFDRIAHINSSMLTKFPILEYITAEVPRGPDGKKAHKFTLDDYKGWVNIFDEGHPEDPIRCKPKKTVDEFLWKYVISSDQTLDRINKVARNMETLDHDDMYAYVPPLDEVNITNVCGTSTGNKKYLTVEGYANVIPGFSQFMRSLSENGKKEQLKQAIKSYVRFEGIVMNRYSKAADKARDNLVRFGTRTLNSPTIVSDTVPQTYMNQLNAAVQEVVAAYRDPLLNEMAAKIYAPEVRDVSTPEGKKEQEAKNLAFEEFGKEFDRVVKKDNGAKMIAIMSQKQLIGMPELLTDEEKAKRKQSFAAKKYEYALE